MPTNLFDFQSYPMVLLAGLFLLCAGVIWLAGTRLAGAVSVIADRTGMEHGFAGLLILGGITSLPEAASAGSSAWFGEANLAVNNLLGALAFQFVLLAVADFAIGRRALTSVVVRPIILLQGALNILLLAVVAASITVGDRAVFGVGVWSSVILATYLVALWLSRRYQGRRPWVADGRKPERDKSAEEPPERETASSTAALAGRVVALGSVILVGGFLLSRSGEAMALGLGLGTGFFGVLVLAAATALPETSTVIGSARHGHYEMAVGDVFGTNQFNVALIFFVDLLYRGGPVLNEVGRLSAFAAILGIVLSTLFVAGLVERGDRTVFRLGVDSMIVVAVYAAGVAILYALS